MPNSRPIVGDTALIDRHGQPGGETVEATTPAESTPDSTESASFAEWRDEASPYFIARAAEPGRFTAFDCIKDAPPAVRNPANRNWPGLLMAQLHHDGVVEHAMAFGLRLFDTSHRPESGGSAVSVWVGVEGQRKEAAA